MPLNIFCIFDILHPLISYNAIPCAPLSYGTKIRALTIDIDDIDGSISTEIPCKFAIEALGATSNSAIVEGLVEQDGRGYIITEKFSPRTSFPGICDAGTVCNPLFRQALISASQEIKAAYDAIAYIKKEKYFITKNHRNHTIEG